MNNLITGGSGLIGTALSKQLIESGHKVRILTREKEVETPFYHWDNSRIDEKVFDDLDGIIHLAGSSIINRWTKNEKEKIVSSRVDTAQLLLKSIQKLNIHLKFFISASGSSYYGQITSDNIFVENAESGNDFLAQVCVKWERAADQFEPFVDRVVKIRTPLVLSSNAKSYQMMKFPTQYGLGASLGSGKQWMPWIHLNDLCRVYLTAVENKNYSDAINATVSEHIQHQNFMMQLAKSFGQKIWLPNIPAALVRLGMGENACLILEGSRLSNKKLLDLGFEFEYSDIGSLLNVSN